MRRLKEKPTYIFNNLKREKDKLVKQAIEVKKLDSIEKIIPIAEEQIQQANNILEKEILTGVDLARVHTIADVWSKSTSIDAGETIFFTEEEIQAIRKETLYLRKDWTSLTLLELLLRI